jgi:hypothetical protein
VTEVKQVCPDCGAQFQRHGGGLRCPWSNASRSAVVEVGGVTAIACGWPYGGARQGEVRPTTYVKR